MYKFLLLLIPTCLLGCLDRDEGSEWYGQEPATYRTANGFSFAMFGPRDSGYLADTSPALDSGLVTEAEIGLALEQRARELARRTGMAEQAAVDAFRRITVWVVDDYSFTVGSAWASGWHRPEESIIVVALWARTETALQADIPADAPTWTIRLPDSENVNWRYGGSNRLVPAADHELGHHFYGAKFEH